MVGEDLGDRSRLFPLFRLNLFEKCDERVWVVAGLVHVLQAQIVGLTFVATRELQERDRDTEVHALINRVSSPTIGDKNHRGDRGELRNGALSLIPGGM